MVIMGRDIKENSFVYGLELNFTQKDEHIVKKFPQMYFKNPLTEGQIVRPFYVDGNTPTVVELGRVDKIFQTPSIPDEKKGTFNEPYSIARLVRDVNDEELAEINKFEDYMNRVARTSISIAC